MRLMEGGENLNPCLEGAEVIFLRKICLCLDLKGKHPPPDLLTVEHHPCLMLGACQEVKFVIKCKSICPSNFPHPDIMYLYATVPLFSRLLLQPQRTFLEFFGQTTYLVAVIHFGLLRNTYLRIS